MSRGLTKSGRPGTEIFPETGKELARRVALTEKIYILKARNQDDGGGSYETEYIKIKPPVRARVDSYKRVKPRGEVAAKINEFTDHVFTVDKTAEISGADRLERMVDESIWEVLAVDDRTDEPTIQVLAKEVTPVDPKS